MLFKIIFPTLALLAMAFLCTAAPDPRYQKPTVAFTRGWATPQNHCDSTSFTYFGDTDRKVPVADCEQILDHWGQVHFTYELARWENSTALADHFYVLQAVGSCEFALKRLDGLDNTMFLGDQDIKDVIQDSISSSQDGVTFETVEGQMNCESDPGSSGEVNFEWTLRTPGSTN